MLFKYTTSATTTDSSVTAQDIALILANAEGASLENLSSNCNTIESGWVDGGEPVTNWWNIEVNDATDRILWRNHTDAANPLKLWTGVRVSGASNIGLEMMADGTGGVTVNKLLIGWSQITIGSPDTTFYIGISDANTFLVDDAGGKLCIIGEVMEPSATHPLYSYSLANRNENMFWTWGVASDTITIPGPVGKGSTPFAYSANSAYSSGNNFASAMGIGFNAINFTDTNSTLYLDDGSTGVVIEPVEFKIQSSGPSVATNGVHVISSHSQTHSLMGTKLTNNTIGKPLFAIGRSSLGYNTSIFLIEGI